MSEKCSVERQRSSLSMSLAFFMITAMLILFYPMFIQPAAAEDVRYLEDFETEDPVKFWTDGGQSVKYRINFKGLTTERSHSGKKSFKLDITFLESGDFTYWSGPIVDIPLLPE